MAGFRAGISPKAVSKDANMDYLISLLQAELQKNQFLAGGAILMILGVVGVWCRKVPLVIWNRIDRWIWLRVEVRATDPAFEWITEWLGQLSYSKTKARLLYLSTGTEGKTNLVPGFGNHWFFYQGRLVKLNRSMASETESSKRDPLVQPQIYRFAILTRDRQIMLNLLKEAKRSFGADTSDMLSVVVPKWGYWHFTSHRLKRPLETVILPEGLGELIMEDIRAFLGKRDWYVDKGIPYRRGYLLYGPPGNGKSSLISSVASELGYGVAVLTLTDRDMSDEMLRDLISRCPKNTVVVIEDIDCIFVGREGSADTQSVSFSGLLNAIDGIAAGDGRILFMTTNHRDKLDPALIRPGRVDFEVKLDGPDKNQIRRAFCRFFPDAEESLISEFVAGCQLESMAAIQGHLIVSGDPKTAVKNLQQGKENASVCQDSDCSVPSVHGSSLYVHRLRDVLL